MKGICMSCGKVFEGATRGLVDAQFSLHNEEKHKVKLRNGNEIVLRFFKNEKDMPKVERKKDKKKESGYLSEARQRELEATAVWV